MAEEFNQAANKLVNQLKEIPPVLIQNYKDDSKAQKMTKILLELVKSQMSLFPIPTTLDGSVFQRICQIYHNRMEKHRNILEEELKKATEIEAINQQNIQARQRKKSLKIKRHIEFTRHTLVKDPLSIKVSLMRTQFFPIRNKEGILQMIEQLEGHNTVAFDTERSIPSIYGGDQRICLIQFSTLNSDFILDTLRPEVRSNVYLLRDLFADPKITKVVHGNDDKNWLKREFDIRIVGEYDSSVGNGNFAQMVYKYTGIQLEKTFQRADWTQRPLPPEMIKYARLDTHYLIRCYEKIMERRNAK